MRFLLVLVVASLFAGCLEEGGRGGPGTTAEAVAFRTLRVDADSGLTEPQRSVLDAREAYEAAWARHASGPNPKGDAPPVDFSRERVVLVALGEKGSGCYGIRIENVTAEGGDVVVHVASYSGEGPGFSCTAVMVQPVHFVAIEAREGVVSFRERSVGPGEPWPPEGEPATGGGPAEPLSTRHLDKGSFSGVHEDTRVVLRTLAEWHAFWQRHDDISSPGVAFPNESVVAVVEHGPTGCFGIHVGNVTYDPAEQVLTIEVVHERTPPDVQCVQALQDAYHFVAIPDRPGRARFVDAEGEPTGAAPPPATSPPTPSAPRGDLPRRTLAAGGASGVDGMERRVLADAASWEAFWAEHASIMEPAPEAPSVDFGMERVFAATAGARPNGCWAIRVTSIEETGSSLRVEVTTYPPPEGTMCAQVVSHPHHVVAFPASDKPLVVAEAEGDGAPPDV